MRIFSVAGLQLELSKGDNLERIGLEVRAAKRRLPWVDMIVLSELSAYGASLDSAESRGGHAETEFCRLARDNGVWLIPGSIYERDGSDIFNVAPVINPDGRIVARYRKIFPFYPYEQGVAPGKDFCVFDVPGVGRIGLSICYDIWFPEVQRTLAFMGAEILIAPSLTNTIDRDVELAFVRANAAANQCYMINVNGAGSLGFGRSIACGPGGEILHQAGTGYEVIALEFDLDVVTRARERGWNGLGQVVKSFRDNEVCFPVYAPGAKSAAFDELGELAKPKSMAAAPDAPPLRQLKR